MALITTFYTTRAAPGAASGYGQGTAEEPFVAAPGGAGSTQINAMLDMIALWQGGAHAVELPLDGTPQALGRSMRVRWRFGRS